MDDQTDTRSDRIKEIFSKLRGCDPSQRAELLDATCAGDPELRAQVEQLLDTYGSALKLIEQFPELIPAPAVPHPARTFSEGEVVSERFRIVRLLGAGGMGEVYEAEDLVLRHEHVALKTLRATLAADPGAIDRLCGELRKARRITHPNVCRVHDVYKHQTTPGAHILFFTMELLKGETLAERLRAGRMTTAKALPLVKQMAAAVDAAHSAHVAHGDFKPGNIMLVASKTAGERVVVTDFGLAHWLPGGSTSLSTTVDSRRWGTPIYMAPEQLLGGDLTRATDIYALGVVLYEMVTGQHPFAADAPFPLALKKLSDPPRPPREYVNDLDRRWEKVILRCLDGDPEKRFEFATDVVEELEHGHARARGAIASMAARARAGAMAAPSVREKVIETSGSKSRAVTSDVHREQTIVLLPFAQEHRTPETDAFSLGLTAAVTDRIAALSRYQDGLHVIPATEVIDTGVDTPVLVHQTLGADLIVTGRLTNQNDRARVTIALGEMSHDGVKVKGHRTVEVRPGDRTLLQNKVATTVARLLGVNLPTAVLQNLREGPFRPEAEKFNLLGRGYLLQGPDSLTSAITAFRRAIQADDRCAAAHAGLSEAYLGHYDATKDGQSLKDAPFEIEEAIKLDPIDARSRVIRGRLYYTTGQYQRAMVEFQKALDLDPNAADARNQLAKAHAADGNTELAEREYRRAVNLHPRYWASYVDLGNFLFLQGRYREAEQNYVLGSEYAPANRKAIANLAAVYEIQGLFPAAEAELIKGLRLSPGAILYNNLGWIYILEGKFEAAVNALKEAVKQPRANSIVWSSLARAYRFLGQHGEEERAAYRTALEQADEEVRVNPMNADIRSNRAYLLAETGHPDEALHEMREALDIGNARGNVTVLFRSALIHERIGNRKDALEALETAARGGYPSSRIGRDPDLRELRNDPRFRRVRSVADSSNRRSY